MKEYCLLIEKCTTKIQIEDYFAVIVNVLKRHLIVPECKKITIDNIVNELECSGWRVTLVEL